MAEGARSRSQTRDAIVEAAADLMRDGGAPAVTTRKVADLADVQAPTIYRLFGDKDGLLEAVAEHVMAGFVSAKEAGMTAAVAAGADPLADLRDSWERQVEFGLAHPAVFRLLSDPDRVRSSSAARAGREILNARVRRLAEAGLLRVAEPRAVALIQAAGVGTISLLLSTPAEDRDAGLGAAMFDAVLTQILVVDVVPAVDESIAPAVQAAVTLRALAPRLDALSDSEQRLLADWLDRVVGESVPR